ncbi:hypothetical protein DFH07DRAFT_950409 [Mycena maculata]|uniref:G domain-containing protein n=1 Tax=Mycena maculata TaxID=230809 RepID=A0AAD7K6H9_9AGAR|nr:hypothetical protein DFH07DRAFT_950409 [Mycena maculata]
MSISEFPPPSRVNSSRLAAITHVFRKMPRPGSPSLATDSEVQPHDLSLDSGTHPAAELPEDSIIDIRAKCPHFRILVIGRANAEKTTLLKRVCNSVKGPEIYDKDGKKIKAKILKESMERGEHDIDNQMIFKSNPGFIFHDSRGFESGAIRETQKAKNFIKTRATSTRLDELWYCLPMADTTRPFLKTDEEFFELEVPVIAIFTKCDGLFTEVRGDLLARGMDHNEVNAACDGKVEEILTARFKELQQQRFAPATWASLGTGITNKNALTDTQDECVKKLVQVTAGALTNEALQLLFISVQRNNLDIS